MEKVGISPEMHPHLFNYEFFRIMEEGKEVCEEANCVFPHN